jgi:hypothetical protein
MRETPGTNMTKPVTQRTAQAARKRGGKGRSHKNGPRRKMLAMTMAAWRVVRVARKLKHARRRRRHGAQRKKKAGELRALSIGSIALGSFALGASAFGALAVGAVAIRRLAIKRAAIGRLDVRKVKVGRLEVDELIVHSDRRPGASAKDAS